MPDTVSAMVLRMFAIADLQLPWPDRLLMTDAVEKGLDSIAVPLDAAWAGLRMSLGL